MYKLISYNINFILLLEIKHFYCDRDLELNGFPIVFMKVIASIVRWFELNSCKLNKGSLDVCFYNKVFTFAKYYINCMTILYQLRPHCKFLYWYQEFLCPVEPLYFSDEKSTTVEK